MKTLDQVPTTDTAIMAALRALVQKISTRDDFAGAILFGSRARRSHNPESDAYVARLLAGTPGEFIQNKLEFDDLTNEILLDRGVRLQPLLV
jgi:antitoxin ChpS